MDLEKNRQYKKSSVDRVWTTPEMDLPVFPFKEKIGPLAAPSVAGHDTERFLHLELIQSVRNL